MVESRLDKAVTKVRFLHVLPIMPLWYSWCVRGSEKPEDTVRFREAAPIHERKRYAHLA